MSKLTYLGVTHIAPTKPPEQPDIEGNLPDEYGRYPVTHFDACERGAHSADLDDNGTMALVGSYWKGKWGNGCAFLPAGAHWRAVHSFRVN